jgi:hypothetical protein
MAQTYGCLPSEVLEKGSTLDIQIYSHVQTLRMRENKIRNKEDITGTYRPEELEELWQNRRR